MRDSENLVIGRAPLLETFKSETTIERVFIQRGLNGGPINTVISRCKQRGIKPEFVNKERLDEISGGLNHQGVCAYISAFSYHEIDEMLTLAKSRGEDPFIVFLDGIEDPQNLGAILRSANLLGAHGVVIEKRGCATLTSSAAKASAGAINHVYVARVTNIKNEIEALKSNGMWFGYTDMSGESMYNVNLKGPLGIVIGNEGKGVSRIVKEYCDFGISIPMNPIAGGVDSFNASVAFGIVGCEIVRQRSL